jgi:hypothetical protein
MTTSSNRGHLEVYAKALGGEERRGEGRRRVGGGVRTPRPPASERVPDELETMRTREGPKALTED